VITFAYRSGLFYFMTTPKGVITHYEEMVSPCVQVIRTDTSPRGSLLVKDNYLHSYTHPIYKIPGVYLWICK